MCGPSGHASACTFACYYEAVTMQNHNAPRIPARLPFGNVAFGNVAFGNVAHVKRRTLRIPCHANKDSPGMAVGHAALSAISIPSDKPTNSLWL